jgi:hypothetical protein
MAVGFGIVLLGLVWWLFSTVGSVAAATPAPTEVTGGDPRSAGEGPGLVGAPLLAIGAVIALGALAALATTVWVRLTDSSKRRDGE